MTTSMCGRSQYPSPLDLVPRSGATLFLQAGGKLEREQVIAHHADSRTTKMYDHSDDDVSIEDIELVQF